MNTLKEWIKVRFTFVNMFFSIILSTITCCIIYHFLYPLVCYSNLSDFFVGTSIYKNHNKYLDIGIFFLYVILFYSFYALNLIKTHIPQINLNKYYKKIFIVIGLLTACIFFYSLFFSFNGLNIILPDTHHYGEKFATYYMHKIFKMNYYSDIMLVHGWIDIIPSYIADNFFGELSFYNERLANTGVRIFFFVFNAILAFCLYGKDWKNILITLGYFLVLINICNGNPYSTDNIHIFTFGLFYLILIHFYNQNALFWYTFFYLTSIFMLGYHTTIGTACFIATLPLLLSKIKENYKAGLCFLCLSSVITISLFGKSILSYLEKAQYYLSSNLYSFGNDFSTSVNIKAFLISTLGFLLFPYFINLLFNENNTKIKFISLYSIILSLSLLTYSFGRIDSSPYIPRALGFSLMVLFVIIPYTAKILKYDQNKLFILLWLIMCSLPVSFYSQNLINFIQYTYKDDSDIEYIKENVPKDKTYLDLTNRGMNYYFSNRKSAIPYTSFFNIVNTKQNQDILSLIEKEPPEIVLTNSYSKQQYMDNLFPAIRLNKLYRYLFLSGTYGPQKRNGTEEYILAYNVKTPFDKNSLKYFDEAFGSDKLWYLPDVWGASTKTLPMDKVETRYSIHNGEIHIENRVRPQDADLAYIEYTVEDKQPRVFSMEVNNLSNTLYFMSKSNKLLIPLDNFPSWLMEKEFRTIRIESNKRFKVTQLVFYKRR